jgi:exodeoxyribonuclease VII small subunit
MQKNFDYKKAKQELEEITNWFESNNQDIEESLENYKKANELIKHMQEYLKNQEAKLKTINK